MLFADTSIFCALYRKQSNSESAIRLVASLSGPLSISPLVVFEFRQSSRLQTFSFSNNRTQGFSAHETERMLHTLDKNIAAGAVALLSPDWPAVLALAEQLSAKHTIVHGHRSMDVLHVATALNCGAEHFLTLDDNQAILAHAAGLNVQSNASPTNG